ncbi:MAG: DUF1015 domain-containing protein [Bacteroidetes bacterium]|nr:DUF1015 domain-containing protein [Bacteroidota bacterium]
MAVIRPFRAWRYAPSLLRQCLDVLSPMTDGFDPDFLQSLYLKPHNSLHLAMPPELPASVRLLGKWHLQDELWQDPLPAFYPLWQTFSLYGSPDQYVRKGFLALVRIEPEERQDGIIPHEGILPAAAEARSELIEQLGMQVTPTHGLYSDPYFRLEAIMEEYMMQPLLDCIDFQGVRVQFSMATHKQDLEVAQELLSTRHIIVADGHHRLAASRSLLRRALDQNPRLPEHHPLRYHLMYLSNLRGQDLRILPIHRVVDVPQGLTRRGFFTDLQHLFEVKPLQSKRPLHEELPRQPYTYELVWGEEQWLLQLRPELDPLELVNAPMLSSVKYLDYTLLHYLVLDKMLGYTWETQSRTPHIRYEASHHRVTEAARKPGKMGFLLNGVDMPQLLAVCNDGCLMPPKSTFFYPKLLNGLLFSSFAPAAADDAFESLFEPKN